MKIKVLFSGMVAILIVTAVTLGSFAQTPAGEAPEAAIARTSGLSSSQTPFDAERAALVALYNSTDGPNWSNNSNWLGTDPVCSWNGVTCNTTGHVTVLSLISNQLIGSIPPELENLTSLISLNLSNVSFRPSNQLSGSIPPELGNLTNLYRLDLSRNQLSGNIPPELGGLTNLWILDLFRNQLSGNIPPELGGLTNLWELDLELNQLSGSIPPELGNLTNLFRLNLSRNQLSGNIPPELGNLTNLYQLNLSYNQLSGNIPPELGNSAKLENLVLSRNQLSGNIPPELGNLILLRELDLSRNALRGEVPATITNLTLLNWYPVDFGYNALVSTDPLVRAFLGSKDADWAETQTVPPANVFATPHSDSAIQLGWTPIPYTADGGYYEISYGSTSGGPYTVHGTTSEKTASQYLVDGLSSGTYYFVVRTYTPAHGDQQNAL